jgi:ABC-type molybdenum transport system ATPase subunit/photorepair protein PhrA
MVVEGSRVRQKASMIHSTPPLLQADRLGIARGDVLLIEELSFALLPGTALHVLGENGAGK